MAFLYTFAPFHPTLLVANYGRKLIVGLVGNHTGYGQFKGTRTTADQIRELYAGLEQSDLANFDMMLTGYIPGAEAVFTVGQIAHQLKEKSASRPGSFFWVLDPVMGDNGKLYVAPEVVPEYRKMIRDADLIVPNQYEAEWLSGVQIKDMASLVKAVEVLHGEFGVPHVVITSVSFPSLDTTGILSDSTEPKQLSVIGSTSTSDGKSRIFQLSVPSLPCFFSGTGDMFAALMVVRLREAVSKSTPDLSNTPSWKSTDDISATHLPLARATELALASMQEILARTMIARDAELAKLEGEATKGESEEEKKKEMHLRKTRAAEVRLVRNLDCLRSPGMRLKAEDVRL